MRFLKNPRLIGAVAVVGAILTLALWPKSLEIDVATVSRGSMQVTLDEEGETRVRERFIVSAPVAGRLQRIAIEPGDGVERRLTVVARLMPAASPLIDPRSEAELAAAVEAARAGIGQAKADRDRGAAALTRAQSNVRRIRSLVTAGAAAAEDLEVAETQLRTAEETVRAGEYSIARAEHELELARARLTPSAAGGKTLDVVAPVDGVILKRLRESESVVPAGEPLLEIGDPHSLEIVADFLSADAVRIEPKAPVLIERWGGTEPLHARVRRVEPSGFMKVSALGVEEQRVNVIVDFASAEPRAQRLGDGYRVEVRVIVWSDEAALQAPVGSFFRRGEDWAVFVVEQDRARLQTVKLGQRNDIAAQILEGLSEGQTIVLHPPDTLTDGARISRRGAR